MAGSTSTMNRAASEADHLVGESRRKSPSLSHVRDLRRVVEREKAEIGVLISLEEPTKPMRSEAASAGFYKTPYGNHPRLQILTIEQLLEGARIDYPPQYARTDATFKRAPKAKPKGAAQLPLVAETQDNYPDE